MRTGWRRTTTLRRPSAGEPPSPSLPRPHPRQPGAVRMRSKSGTVSQHVCQTCSLQNKIMQVSCFSFKMFRLTGSRETETNRFKMQKHAPVVSARFPSLFSGQARHTSSAYFPRNVSGIACQLFHTCGFPFASTSAVCSKPSWCEVIDGGKI